MKKLIRAYTVTETRKADFILELPTLSKKALGELCGIYSQQPTQGQALKLSELQSLQADLNRVNAQCERLIMLIPGCAASYRAQQIEAQNEIARKIHALDVPSIGYEDELI